MFQQTLQYYLVLGFDVFVSIVTCRFMKLSYSL